MAFEAGEYAVTTPGHNGDLPMVVKSSQEKSRTSTLMTASLMIVMSSLHEFRQIIEGQTLNAYTARRKLRMRNGKAMKVKMAEES